MNAVIRRLTVGQKYYADSFIQLLRYVLRNIKKIGESLILHMHVILYMHVILHMYVIMDGIN